MQILEPIKSIKKNHFNFWAWFVCAIFLGLLGQWTDLIALHVNGMKITWDAMVNITNFAPFVIVLLAEGIASMIGSVKSGTNDTAASIRKLAFVISILIVAIQLVVYSTVQSKTITQRQYTGTPVILELVLFFAAVIFACYLYCFRFTEWESGLEEISEKETQEIDSLANKAQGISADEGVKL